MVASFVLSSTFVPVLAAWLLKPHKHEAHHAADETHARPPPAEHVPAASAPENGRIDGERVRCARAAASAANCSGQAGRCA